MAFVTILTNEGSDNSFIRITVISRQQAQILLHKPIIEKKLKYEKSYFGEKYGTNF